MYQIGGREQIDKDRFATPLYCRNEHIREYSKALEVSSLPREILNIYIRYYLI